MDLGQRFNASDVTEPTSTSGNATSNEGDSSSNAPTVYPNLRYENEPGMIPGNLQNVSYIYREDAVRGKTNSKIGIVTEVAGDSDSDSSITDAEDEGEDDKGDKANSNTEGDVESKRNLNGSKNTEDDEYKDSSLTPDQVRVLWMDGSETTESVNEVAVVDRGFLQGDYVAAASDPTGQIGIVVDIDINVDLLTHDGILKDIPSKDLKRIRDFTVGDHVVFGPWLGRIEDVFDNVTVLLDDGSVCKVIKADPLRLKPVAKNILEDGHFPYYPGQRVKASSSSVFKNSRWLSGAWKANRLEGTVAKVTVGSLFVYWIASAGYGSDSAATPAEEQSPKNLKLLSYFAHTNWQLGDWCFLPSSPGLLSIPLDKGLSKSESCDSSKHEPEFTETGDESDAEVNASEESNGNSKLIENCSEVSLSKNIETSENRGPPESSLGSSPVSDSKGAVHEPWRLHHKKMRKVVVRKDKKARKKIENFERALLIINTKTKVDVVWQDGTINQGLDSTSLIPIDSPGDHEFVAEQYVLEKTVDYSNDHAEIRRVGIVKSVNANDRTACVRWLKPVVRPEDPIELDKEEMVSVYELEGHPDYDYCYGDVVIRLSPVSSPTKKDSVEDRPLNSPDESKDEEKYHESNSKENESKLDLSTESSDLSWVGNITGLQNGDIEVTWADGMISTVGPQAIYVVGRDDDESIAGGTYPSDDAASWETVEDNNIETVDNAKEDQETVKNSEIKPEIEESKIATDSSETNGAFSVSRAALGFMTRLASGIFSTGQNVDTKTEDYVESDELTLGNDPANESTSQEPNEVEHQLSKLTTKSEGGERDVTEANVLLESTETLCKLKPPVSDASTCDESISKFKGFDIVRDPFDHYFLGALGQNNAARKWLKKVQRDWDILQNNLPEGIYVRAYEDRMDLLKAVIVGAYGTPYQDGLFFFDFLLPPDYPDVPPSAYYHSGGWRINPNLYEEGKVCLSLLNTWTGRGNEVWDPSTSTILQVLVSLQGLVLNSKPYFNEAGYDKQVGTAEGEKNSLSYNENTFLLNCKTMMYVLRKPPKDLEELVVEHFKNRGYYILKACDAYMKGHLIGSLRKDASISTDNNNNANSNSVGFKLMLAKFVPRLFSALKEAGTECQEFSHLIQS